MGCRYNNNVDINNLNYLNWQRWSIYRNMVACSDSWWTGI